MKHCSKAYQSEPEEATGVSYVADFLLQKLNSYGEP